jgi:hypothetical protein
MPGWRVGYVFERPLDEVFCVSPEARGPVTRDAEAKEASGTARRGVSQSAHENKIAGGGDE